MPLPFAISAFISAIPKVEIHVHLIGSADAVVVAALAARHNSTTVPHDPDAVSTYLAFGSFEHFIDVYGAVNALVTTPADIADLIATAGARLATQNVRYAEMTITPFSHVNAGIPYGAVKEALTEGRRRAQTHGIDFAWVFDIPGEMGIEAANATTTWATDDPPDHLVAFGLGGIEAGVDRAGFAEHFDRARATGLRSVPHAGEGDGPASIWAALGFLRADRIGHGIRAIEDPRLVEHLVRHRVPLEVCPSSNVCTRVVPDLAAHPVKQLLDAGVVVTLNTDDPPMFSTILTDEYGRVAETFGLTIAEISQIARNGINAAFIDDATKQRWCTEIDDLAAGVTT